MLFVLLEIADELCRVFDRYKVLVVAIVCLLVGCAMGCTPGKAGEARPAALAENDGVGLNARAAVKPAAAPLPVQATAFDELRPFTEEEFDALQASLRAKASSSTPRPTANTISGPADGTASRVTVAPPLLAFVSPSAPTVNQAARCKGNSCQRQAATSRPIVSRPAAIVSPAARFFPQWRGPFPRLRRLFN